ncbi:hypothetical protein [Heliophilum fasciatum]|uniref:Uncharacterized protein n=1 Tax=Heliophilum fasciatum TaxID=35700 RepID=A0A4R2RKT2_9FIRM|nr:hypothetical protein [Heliophilum fasciatum]MCW2278378.1 hypothetical protein [Heliophilum fasciatum]TCP63723.1 hypothetical protein EDD73_11667 [Heliophilum fasciatum]
MKIDEVRRLLNEYDDDDLRLIIAEMYKRIPKKMLEEKAIDELLQNPVKGKGKRPAPQNTVDPGEVFAETETFIDYAFKQYYLAPNVYVHKKDRPKWRFLAKRLFKQLVPLTQDPRCNQPATALLVKWYTLMCTASGEYLFSTEEPFRSMGLSQEECYVEVLSALIRNMDGQTWIAPALSLIVDQYVDRETLPKYMMNALIDRLNTDALKTAALEACCAELKKLPKPRVHEKYEIKERREQLAEFGMFLYMEMGDIPGAWDFIKNYYGQQEIALFVLLSELRVRNEGNAWRQIFEQASAEGVQPRDSLKKEYRQYKAKLGL